MVARVLLVSVVIGGMLSLPVFADTVYMEPEDWVHNSQYTGTDPNYNYEEQNLYVIYNQLYGTSYTSSLELAQDARVDWERYTAEWYVESLTLWAVWRGAYMQQNFGYYTESGEYNPLFTVDGIIPGYPETYGEYIGDRGIIGVIDDPSLLGSIGFYDDARPQGPPYTDQANETPAWGIMHSEAYLNYYYDPYATDPDYANLKRPGKLSKWPNMYEEVHFLILETPDPDVFLLAIEDLPYGHDASHRDYNDFLVELHVSTGVIPEPASLTLLGLGLAGLGIRKFAKKA